MLVDINLLPQKEKSKSWRLLIGVIALAVIASIVTAMWFYYQSKVQTVDRLHRELSSQQQLRQMYEEKETVQEVTPITELENAVEWAENTQKETHLLLKHLASLLHERGFLQSFSYQSQGSVNLTVQFDSTRQAADFLNHLNRSVYMKDVELQSISTSELQEEETFIEEALPRYIANFTLQLDANALLANQEEKEGSQ